MATTIEEGTSRVEAIVEKYPRQPGSLIPILQDVQAVYGFLSQESLDEVGDFLGISANEIYGVATFYTQFRFTPPGKHTITVCQGTACHVRGGQQVLDEFAMRLGIKPGETTEDMQFGLERVACLGCCALAPVVSVDGEIYAGVSAKKVPSILKKYRDD